MIISLKYSLLAMLCFATVINLGKTALAAPVSENNQGNTTHGTSAEMISFADETIRNKAFEILDDFRDSIRTNWRKLTKQCDHLGGLYDEMPHLPDNSFWDRDKSDLRKEIRVQLSKIRNLLLSTDARRLLLDIERIDASIIELEDDIREVTTELVLSKGKKSKLEAKLAKLRAKRHELEDHREEAARFVCAELGAIGLRLSGTAAEKCLFTVNINDLIDAAVVAKHIEIVVEALGEQMKSKGSDVMTAKRYYGVYIAMLEVQRMCFKEYLDKSRKGAWRVRLSTIRNEANQGLAQALLSAEDTTFSESQRAIFLKNAETYRITKRAVDAYVEILDRHEGVITEKANAVDKMLEVARSSLATAKLAGDFLSLVKTNEETFDALLRLELPPLEIFDDAALQAEFLALTDKLNKCQ